MAKKNEIKNVFGDDDFSVEVLTKGKAAAVKAAEANRRDGFLNDVTMVRLCLDKEFEKAGIVIDEQEDIILRPIGRSITKDRSTTPPTETTTGIRYLVINGNVPATIRITFDQFAVFKSVLGLDIVTGNIENGTDIFGSKFNGDIVIRKTAIVHRGDTTIKYPVRYYNEFNPKDDNKEYISRVPLLWNEWLFNSIGTDAPLVTAKDGRTSWMDEIQKKNRRDLPFVQDEDGRAVQTDDQRDELMGILNDVVIPSGMADRFTPYDPSKSDSDLGEGVEWAFPAVEYIVEFKAYGVKSKASKSTTK